MHEIATFFVPPGQIEGRENPLQVHAFSSWMSINHGTLTQGIQDFSCPKGLPGCPGVVNHGGAQILEFDS